MSDLTVDLVELLKHRLPEGWQPIFRSPDKLDPGRIGIGVQRGKDADVYRNAWMVKIEPGDTAESIHERIWPSIAETIERQGRQPCHSP